MGSWSSEESCTRSTRRRAQTRYTVGCARLLVGTPAPCSQRSRTPCVDQISLREPSPTPCASLEQPRPHANGERAAGRRAFILCLCESWWELSVLDRNPRRLRATSAWGIIYM